MSKEPQEFEEHDDDQRDDEGLRRRIDRLVPEVLRRTFYAGVGAVFTTEEGIRKLASEVSMPKDVATYLISSAQGTKKELFRIVAQEMRGFLEGLNLTEEMQRVLTTVSFEIKTEIRFIPNDTNTKLKPRIKNKVAVKRNQSEEEVEEEKEPTAEDSEKDNEDKEMPADTEE